MKYKITNTQLFVFAKRGCMDLIVFQQLVMNNKLEEAKQMVAASPANVQTRDNDGNGVLSYYCGQMEATNLSLDGSHDDMLRDLLNLGVSLELDSDGKRMSPLHYCRYKKMFARILIDASIPVDITDSNGYTPLYYAIVCQNRWGAKVLIDAGAKVEFITRPNAHPWNQRIIPKWVPRFVSSRENARASSIAILCLVRCCWKLRYSKDVLRCIARCVWESRGYKRVWRRM